MYVSSLPVKMNTVLAKFSVCSRACSPPPAIFFWSTSGNFCVTWSITFWCLGKFRALRERNEETGWRAERVGKWWFWKGERRKAGGEEEKQKKEGSRLKGNSKELCTRLGVFLEWFSHADHQHRRVTEGRNKSEKAKKIFRIDAIYFKSWENLDASLKNPF